MRAPFEVSGERGSFKVKVRADSVRRAEEVLRSEYPDSEVRLVFPIDGEDFFAHHGEDDRAPRYPTIELECHVQPESL